MTKYKTRYMPAQDYGIFIDLNNPQAQAVVITRQDWRGAYIYLPLTDIAFDADLNPDELDHFLDWHVGGQLIAQVAAAWNAAADCDHSTGDNAETLAAYRKAARLEYEMVERIREEVEPLPEPCGHWFAWDYLTLDFVLGFGVTPSTSYRVLAEIADRIVLEAEEAYVSLVPSEVYHYLCDIVERLAEEDARATALVEEGSHEG